jgi:hypothetical protein
MGMAISAHCARLCTKAVCTLLSYWRRQSKHHNFCADDDPDTDLPRINSDYTTVIT